MHEDDFGHLDETPDENPDRPFEILRAQPARPLPKYPRKEEPPSTVAKGFKLGIGFFLAACVFGFLMLGVLFVGCLYVETDGFDQQELRRISENDAIDKYNKAHPDQRQLPLRSKEEFRKYEYDKEHWGETKRTR